MKYVLIFIAGAVVALAVAFFVVRPDSLSRQLADLRTELASDLKTWTARLSDLQGRLSDSESTVDKLQASLDASRGREQRAIAEARTATDRLNAILQRPLQTSGDADAAVERLQRFGDLAALALGIEAEGVRPGASQSSGVGKSP